VLGVFERTQAAGSYTEYGKLKSAAPRALVYLDANPRNMHHKFIILDGETTVAGSFNFSDGADKQNDENVVIIRSRSIAQQFEQEFQRVYGAAQKAEEAKLVGSR
jgi:phosphatidylserine/phosphatidylglycerophosphate/cardiolipin synthase-like enzyme